VTSNELKLIDIFLSVVIYRVSLLYLEFSVDTARSPVDNGPEAMCTSAAAAAAAAHIQPPEACSSGDAVRLKLDA
jgi:hypothetical protein